MKRFLGVLLAGTLVLGGLAGCAQAEFKVSPLTITPSQVVPGEPFTASAEITNVGNADGVYTATLTVNGTEVATKDIAVAAGGTEQVSFTLTEETPGIYEIALNDITVSLKLLSTDEIVRNAIQSMYKVDTYQFDMKIIMNMSGVVDDEEVDVKINIDSNGTADNVNRRMWAEVELAMEMTIPEEEKMVAGVEMYIIGNDSYTLVEVEDETSPWMKERLPVGSWSEMTEVDTQVAILETGGATLKGSERVRGEDCYVLQIIPDEEKLVEMVLQETTMSGEQVPAMTEEIFEELVKDAIVKQWVRKDNFSIAKLEVIMEGEITPDMVTGYGEGKLTVKMTMTILTYGYNKPVYIELPTEAKEAISWEDTGLSEAAETELINIQTATIALMVDNQLSILPNPVTVATNDMTAFPDTTAATSKGTDPNGNTYDGNDKAGFILYQHDITADGAQTGLVNYVATRYTIGTYIVDSTGTVTQVTTGYE